MRPMSEAMGDLPRLASLIESSVFDAVIALSPENVRYAADVHISTQSAIRDRLAMVVWPSGGKPVLIVCAVEEGYARERSWIEDVRTYREFHLAPIALLAQVLRELGLARARVGIETSYLCVQAYHELIHALPELCCESGDALLSRARMRKTPREIQALRRGFRGTEHALLSTFSRIEAGETEQDMAVRLADAMLRGGADSVAFNHINAGANTGFPHKTPSQYRVRPGDLVKADSGGLYQEYYSNVGRTAKLGQPSPEQASAWSRLREIHHRLIEMVRPGSCGRRLFEAAVDLHARAGIAFPFGHNGHGIGLQVHEPPILGPRDETPYLPGMITTVETRMREEARLGLHMNDLIEITEGAPIVHTGAFVNEEIMVI